MDADHLTGPPSLTAKRRISIFKTDFIKPNPTSIKHNVANYVHEFFQK